MMPFLLLKLLGIGRWLREAFSALFGLARRYPLQAAIFALLALLAWTYHGKVSAIGQRDAAVVGREAAIAGRAADRKAYTAAQAEAERLQRETDHVAIDRQLAFNAQQEQNHVNYEQTRRSAVADYARAHPVRVCRQAAGGAPGGTLVAAVPGDSGVAADGHANGDLADVSAADLDAFSQTELQNRERGEYLRGLIAIGWAIPGN